MILLSTCIETYEYRHVHMNVIFKIGHYALYVVSLMSFLTTSTSDPFLYVPLS